MLGSWGTAENQNAQKVGLHRRCHPDFTIDSNWLQYALFVLKSLFVPSIIMSAVPRLAIDEETAIVAGYMKAKFPGVLRHHLSAAHPPPCTIGHPKHWSLSFCLEVDLALDVIARAFHNTGILPHMYTPRPTKSHCSFHGLGCPKICRSHWPQKKRDQ